MRSLAVSLTLICWNLPALAAPGSEMATGGSLMMMMDELPAATAPVPVSNKPQVGTGWQQAAPARPSAPAAPAPAVQTAPEAPPAAKPESRCIPNRPYKESTPMKIHVDQINQTATLTSPDFPPGQTLTFKVSTGGPSKLTRLRDSNLVSAAKIPDPKSKVAPYCPETKAITKPKLVTSFVSSEFEGRRDCTDEEKRGRTTVFPGNTYTSTQFNALMPNALRFRVGQFFHRCPSGEACNNLGQPASGECVRVPGWQKPPDWMTAAIREKRMDTSAIAFRNNRYRTSDDRIVTRPEIEISETLVKQALKYGAYDVTLSDPPPMRQRGEPASKYPYPTRMYCDQQDIEIAKRIQALGEEPEGGWDAPDIGSFFKNVFGGIGSLFGGGTQTQERPSRPAPPPRPETEQERKERERQERRNPREDWRKRVFDNT